MAIKFDNIELINLQNHAGTNVLTLNGSNTNVTFSGTVTATYFYGDGSNLTNITASNADTVDTLHASSFLRSDAADTATGQLFFDAGFDSHPIMLSGSQNFDNIDRSGFYNLYNTHTGSTNSPGFPYGTMIAIGNDKGGQGFGLQIAHERTGTGMYVRGMNDTASAWSAWAEIWTSTTDGAGSGLDADLLDGLEAGSFLRSDANDTGTGIITLSQNNSTTPYPLIVKNVSNANGVGIEFDDNLNGTQRGYISHFHSDTKSYGSGAAMVISSSESTTTILADGKLMYKEGIYSKPSSGTGAGSRKDNLWDEAYNNHITGIAVTGTGTKTITLTQKDGGTISANFTDQSGSSGTVAEAYALDVEDTRAAQRAPSEMPDHQVSAEFTDKIVSGWHSLINVKGWHDGYASWQLIGPSNTTAHNNLYFRSGVGTSTSNWSALHKIWHSGNDGSGSTLDADTVDGIEGASFLRSDTSDTAAGQITFSQDISVGSQTGTWITSNVMSDAIGWNTSYGVYIGSNVGGTHYIRGNGTFTTGGNTYNLWHEGNDGGGSGLDADKVDNLHASDFLRSNANDSFTGDELHFPTLDLSISNNNSQNQGNTYFRGSGTHFVLGLNSGNTLYLNYGNSAGQFRAYGNAMYWNDTNIGTPWGSGNDGSGTGLDADSVDGYHASRFFRRLSKASANVGPGWVTVAQNTSGREAGEIIVTDADSGDHAYIRIEWMRSYADSHWTVLNTGGHSNRITGVRVLKDGDDTYGNKKLQVYCTVQSTYEVNIYEQGDIDDYGVHSVVTPVVQNSISGYSAEGNSYQNLDTYPFSVDQGIQGLKVRTDSDFALGSGGKIIWENGYGNPYIQDYYGSININAPLYLGASGTASQNLYAAGVYVAGNEVWHAGSTGLGGTNRITDLSSANNSVPSGFYQYYNGSNYPTTGTWYNLINVRHSNTANDHGFQIAASYYDENIWTRTYSGGSGANNGTYTTWRRLYHEGHKPTLSELGAAASSHTHSASDITSGTFSDLFSPSTRYNIGLIDGSSSQTRDKIRVWNSSTYTIGMKSGFTYGHLNDYAMSFQMNSDNDRGWWWGDTSHSDAQGAMSLTTNGRLTVATSISVGQGENTTSPSTHPLYVAGGIQATGDIIAYYSDERLKHFHGKIDNPIDKIKQLNGYYFTENEKAKELGYDNDKQQVGVNAQEVQKVLPEVVDVAPVSYKEGVDEEYLTVHYDKLVPLLIEAVKEQQDQIELLKAEIKELKNK